MIKIEYSCDRTGDHRAPLEDCVVSRTQTFDNLDDALNFFEECSEPLTQLSEIYNFKEHKSKKLKKFIDYD